MGLKVNVNQHCAFSFSDDHSRIILKKGSPDYINANLVEVCLAIIWGFKIFFVVHMHTVCYGVISFIKILLSNGEEAMVMKKKLEACKSR